MLRRNVRHRQITEFRTSVVNRRFAIFKSCVRELTMKILDFRPKVFTLIFFAFRVSISQSICRTRRVFTNLIDLWCKCFENALFGCVLFVR
ncbi:MAG: hypothetical protein EBS84_20980 [Proteobacteria bacterium]|nr:hypothetical protein [Verrucomicrobiota bacterium]NBU11451.1 hypothetical protein [Pseudomonadota bacterium]